MLKNFAACCVVLWVLSACSAGPTQEQIDATVNARVAMTATADAQVKAAINATLTASAPTQTPIPTATSTLLPTSTATPTMIPTNTPAPTDTPVPTDTPAPTATRPPTSAPRPTARAVAATVAPAAPPASSSASLLASMKGLLKHIQLLANDNPGYIFCSRSQAASVPNNYEAITNSPQYDVTGSSLAMQDANNRYQSAISIIRSTGKDLYQFCINAIAGTNTSDMIPFQIWGPARQGVNQAQDVLILGIAELEGQ